MASCTQVNSLFQAYIDGELAGAEKVILEQHLRECGACQSEVNGQNACSAQLFEALRDQRLMWGLRARVLAHLPEMEVPVRHGSHPTDTQLAQSRSRSRFPAMIVAAAAVVIATASAIFYTGTVAAPPRGTTVGMVTFSDGKGVLRKPAKAAEYELADLKSLVATGDQYETLTEGRLALALIGGSTVKANYNTVLTVDDNRRVRVDDGLTFFDIGEAPRHFYVETPTGKIQVAGTAFIVDVEGDTTTLTVTEGDVLVSNDVGKTFVPHGKQLKFTRSGKLGEPYALSAEEIEALLAWANAIVPDPDALALFLQTLEYRQSASTAIQAEPIYIVSDLRDRAVNSLRFEWQPDGLTTGHCGYIVRVTDTAGNLLLLDSLGANSFNDQTVSRIEIAPPNGYIEDVESLHIRLQPDHTPGKVEVEMTDIKAVVIGPAPAQP